MNKARQSFENPRSANKNVVIDRVESLGQVGEYGCTVMSLIDGGYDVI